MRIRLITTTVVAACLAVIVSSSGYAGTDSQFAAGNQHSLAVKTDGTLWSWGGNYSGQLGFPTPPGATNYTPAQVDGGTDWSTVAAGASTSLALKTDGTLWVWGEGAICGLGIPGVFSSTVPVQIGTDNSWMAVSTSGDHTLALKADGTMWGWGTNIHGQVGIGTQGDCVLYPAQLGGGTIWTAVATGVAHSLGLASDGTLWAWGFNGSGQVGDGGDPLVPVLSPKKIGEDNDWIAIAAGGGHSLALKISGSLWSWGSNSHGELGNGTGGDMPVPTQVGSDTDWSMISGGWRYTLAVKADGSLWSWGDNQLHKLGLGRKFKNVAQVEVPTMVGKKADWAVVSAGDMHSMASNTGQVLWAWGYNSWGQLGVGTQGGDYYSPVEVMSLEGSGTPPLCTDTDLDGYSIEGGECGPVDCDDLDNQVNPGASESCGDGKDNDCDGKADCADKKDCNKDPVCS